MKLHSIYHECTHQPLPSLTHEHKLWQLDSSEQSCSTQLKGWVLRGLRKTCPLHPSWKPHHVSLSFFPGCPHTHLFSTSSPPSLSLLLIPYTASTNSSFSGSSEQRNSMCHLAIRCRRGWHREWVGLTHQSVTSLPDSCTAPLVWASGSWEISVPPPQVLSAVGHTHNPAASQSKGRFSLTYSGGVECTYNYNQTLIKSFSYAHYHYSELTQNSRLRYFLNWSLLGRQR